MTDAPMQELAEASEPLSVDSAAALLTRSMEQERAAPREPNGQFAAKQAEKVEEKPEDKVVDLKTGKPPVEAKEEPPAEEDDEDLEFELPPEKEGAEPQKLKLSALYDGYTKAQALEKEIEQLRSQSKTVPAEYQTALQETIQTRGRYLEGLDFLKKTINPVRPSLEMLDPANAKYDPDGYRFQAQKFDQDRALLYKIDQDARASREQQEQQQDILNKAHSARETAALHKAWPESKDDAVLKRVAEGLARDYGFTNDEIQNISDHRQLLVIRDALELRALKAKQADAVKVVRAKPKLVKGTARSTTDPKATARTNAMSRLQATGSMDAAAEFVKGLMK